MSLVSLQHAKSLIYQHACLFVSSKKVLGLWIAITKFSTGRGQVFPNFTMNLATESGFIRLPHLNTQDQTSNCVIFAFVSIEVYYTWFLQSLSKVFRFPTCFCYFECFGITSQTGKSGLCFINIDLYSKKSAIEMQVNLWK